MAPSSKPPPKRYESSDTVPIDRDELARRMREADLEAQERELLSAPGHRD